MTTAPRAFISYSWSNPDHEEWVLALAKDLVDVGVHAIIDKWDLREGQEANAFMESMVTDPTITKVIIVSDRVYAEKSDGRLGGAGTEAQIISPKIFSGHLSSSTACRINRCFMRSMLFAAAGVSALSLTNFRSCRRSMWAMRLSPSAERKRSKMPHVLPAYDAWRGGGADVQRSAGADWGSDTRA